LLLGGLVVAPGAVQVVDRGQAKCDVVAQFVALGADQHVFQHLGLLALQPLGLDHQQAADGRNGQQQGSHRQHQDLGLQFHA